MWILKSPNIKRLSVLEIIVDKKSENSLIKTLLYLGGPQISAQKDWIYQINLKHLYFEATITTNWTHATFKTLFKNRSYPST